MRAKRAKVSERSELHADSIDAFGDTRISAFGDTRINAFGHTRISEVHGHKTMSVFISHAKMERVRCPGNARHRSQNIFNWLVVDVHNASRNTSSTHRVFGTCLRPLEPLKQFRTFFLYCLPFATFRSSEPLMFSNLSPLCLTADIKNWTHLPDVFILAVQTELDTPSCVDNLGLVITVVSSAV